MADQRNSNFSLDENFTVLPELEEVYGSSAVHSEYMIKDERLKKCSRKEGLSKYALVKRTLKDAFLPQGYPSSVSSDYLEYQKWDTLQAFCSSITGTLATHAVLKGAGVGDSSASAIAATVTWMLKDGAGMLGRILFAWLQGSALDCNAKQWRLVADILNDSAIFIDLLAPFLPHLFLLVMCLSSIARSVVGVAGGATRAALTQHQALKDNMADVSAKDGSQETMVNFTALLVSLVLTPAVADKQNLVWMLFILFTGLHLFANWRAVKAVVMDTLNYNRFHQAVDLYLKGQGVFPPSYINPRETLLPWSKTFLKLDLGCPLHTVLKSKDRLKTEHYNYKTTSKKYILRLDCKQRKVYIALAAVCKDKDILQAVYHKEVIEYFMNYRRFSEVLMREKLEPHSGPLILRLASMCFNGLATFDEEEELVNYTGNLVKTHFPYLLSDLNDAGWNVSKCLLGAGEWRYSWKIEEYHAVLEDKASQGVREEELEEYH